MNSTTLLLSLSLASLLAAAPASAARAPARPQASASRMVLPFVQDDYTRAVAEARARRVPLFIEAWAPW
ncbi:MAG TPA: hypothetical protein VMS88_05860 [Terriglobales bacterium]|nr:hypothetical protein [Terriglobales bacterium]